MRAVLLIAWREFRQVVRTRGFWISLLVLPLALGVTYLGQRLGGPSGGVAYMLVDGTGQYGSAIRQRLEMGHQRQVLIELSRYEARWLGEGPAEPRRWFSEAEVAEFIASGGAPARLRTLQTRLPEEAPPFEPPSPAVAEAAPPRSVAAARDPAAVEAAVWAFIGEQTATDYGRRRLTTVVYIPPQFGETTAAVRVWTSGVPSATVIEVVRSELARQLRRQALAGAGVPAEKVAAIESLQAPVLVTSAPPRPASRMTAGSILPLGAAYLLLMSMLMSGSLLLQGVMEERSNKLLEAVLACVTPAQLMYGKLLGLGAVGLIMIGAWGGCAALAAASVDGPVGEVIKAVTPAAGGGWLLAAVLFYFFAGQVMYATLFLAVGSMSDSMQDAQGYLTPIMLTVLLPFMLLMGQMMRNPDGFLPTVLPWIPIYTPFAMLARMGQGVSVAEAVGTSVLLVAFIAVELVLLGRLFRRNLLRTGQPPRLGELARLMRAKAGD
ncbi:ABC transporter permease [Phenylobacterium terrae]|uniref:ABC transporter permease n=1 Tax=Phenylobacterium terrae TaxID=2665495 RepID=A0ABW4MZP0_9CAUL